MRLSDRAYMIDVLALALKHEMGEATATKVMNGYRYTLALTCSPDASEMDDISERIRQYHLRRGCCDGVDVVKCPRLGEQPKPDKAKRERAADEFEGTE